MESRRPILPVLLFLVACLYVSPADAQAPRPNNHGKPIAEGPWGGANLQLEVTAKGATLEFACANGDMAEPLTADRKGHFQSPGTYNRQQGMVMAGAQPIPAASTIYKGTVHGDTMTLEFTLPGAQRPEGPFTLTRGYEVRINKCN